MTPVAGDRAERCNIVQRTVELLPDDSAAQSKPPRVMHRPMTSQPWRGPASVMNAFNACQRRPPQYLLLLLGLKAMHGLDPVSNAKTRVTYGWDGASLLISHVVVTSPALNVKKRRNGG